jgi:hypothetical protein
MSGLDTYPSISTSVQWSSDYRSVRSQDKDAEIAVIVLYDYILRFTNKFTRVT